MCLPIVFISLSNNSAICVRFSQTVSCSGVTGTSSLRPLSSNNTISFSTINILQPIRTMYIVLLRFRFWLLHYALITIILSQSNPVFYPKYYVKNREQKRASDSSEALLNNHYSFTTAAKFTFPSASPPQPRNPPASSRCPLRSRNGRSP